MREKKGGYSAIDPRGKTASASTKTLMEVVQVGIEWELLGCKVYINWERRGTQEGKGGGGGVGGVDKSNTGKQHRNGLP